MTSTRRSVALSLWIVAAVVQASIHVVQGPSVGWRATERMFANPPGKNGSIVRVDFNATPIDPPSSDVDYAVVVAIFDLVNGSVVPGDYCSMDYTSLNMTDHIVGRVFSSDAANNNAVRGSEEFVVQHSGSQVVVLATCTRPKLIIESFFNESTLDIPYEDFGLETVFNITGAIAFKNSYGYLPGLMWGLLPFSGGLSLAYIMSLLLFVVLVICNRPSLIRLHYFILVVLVLMTSRELFFLAFMTNDYVVETVLWFVTYWQLNATGEAICCPYPPLILASTAMKVVSKLVARVLTTIICLGYGIARPHLTVPETGLVVGLALCYIVSTGVLEILHLSNQAQGNMEPPVVWEALAIATDGCFAGWIFASLVLTRKTLRRTGQTAKYQMYDILFKVLVVFIVLAFAFTLFENAVYAKRIASFPWEYLWMLWAGSRLLNFAVIVVVSIIWRPTETSFLYANSMQLPSSEDDCAKQDVVSQDSPGIQEIVVEEEKKSEDAV